MKYLLPLFCSLVLIGCSDTSPSEAPTTSETAVQTPAPTESNQSTTAETNTSPIESSVTPTTAIDGTALFGQKCSACHGSKAEKSALGKSQVIAGWKEAQLKDALKGYRAGTYGKEMKAVMQGQAKELNDMQIDALAKHISSL